VVGVGMTPFSKPGAEAGDYPALARVAGEDALADASLPYDAVEQVVAGYVYGDSTTGQRAVYELGLTGVPIVNVNNNCSTGSSALFLGRQAIESGAADCTLALGFERMARGALPDSYFPDRAWALERHLETVRRSYEDTGAPYAVYLFGAAGREHMQRYGTTEEQFASVAVKNHAHAARNPRAQNGHAHTLDEVLDSRAVYAPLTKLQCSPPSVGAAAAVVCSEAFVERRGLEDRAVELVAQAMATDTSRSFEGGNMVDLVGADMTRRAAAAVYEHASLGPDDVDVIELHDCFTTNEVFTYEALGLCAEGEGGALAASNETTYGGRCVVNPSGGLIGKGHPLGATGLAQCAELVWQLRGEAGERQVDGARVALQHNLGLGGAVVVSLYRRPAS
jgi:acetyl-CoA acyltransferase